MSFEDINQLPDNVAEGDQGHQGHHELIHKGMKEIYGLINGIKDKDQSTEVNAIDYGLVGDGVADDTAAINRAIAAAPEGGTVIIPPRKIRLDGSIANSNKPIKILAYGTEIINWEAGTPFNLTGGFETTYNVTSLKTVTIAETETNNDGIEIVVTGTPGWKKGDAVKIFADDPIPGGRPETGSTQRRVGQSTYVQSCNGSTVVLMGKLDDPMTDNIRVAKYKDVSVHLAGPTLSTRPGRVIPPASVGVASVASNTLTLADARPDMYDGGKVTFSGTTLPTGITAGTEYYVIVVSPTQIKLATSKTNAMNKTAINVSGTPTDVTALFKSWSGSMISFNSVRNLSLRDVVIKDSPNQAIAFTSCFGGEADNIEVRNCYDNVNTGAFGYGVNMNGSTNVTVSNYRAARVRHAYTDDSSQIAVNANAYQYGRTRNCGVVNGFASSTSNTAWDTHHNGIYGFFTNVYAEDCNIGVSFRGRYHRLRNLQVHNVRIAIRAFCETDGGESFGHTYQGVYGDCLRLFNGSVNPVGHPKAGVREAPLNVIRDVSVTGCEGGAVNASNMTVLMERWNIEFGAITGGLRVFDFTNCSVRAKDMDLTIKSPDNGVSIRFWREQDAAGTFQIDGMRLRNDNTFPTKFLRLIENAVNMNFEVTNLVMDYNAGALVGGTTGSCILEYRMIVQSTDCSEYLRYTAANIADGTPGRALRLTRKSPVALNLAPETDTTMATLYDGKSRGQIVHVRNSGTANAIFPHDPALKLIMKGGAQVTIPPNGSMTLMFIPSVGWCEV